MQFNRILKELRLEMGYTQTELASKAHLATSCIAMFETNKREPTANSLIALANAFNVSTDYLLGLEDDFGTRTASTAAPTGDVLSSEERKLIEQYRQLNTSGKHLIDETLKTLLTTASAAKSEQKKKF